MGNDSKLEMRPAAWEDMERLYAWTNEEQVRRNSFHTDPVTWEEHEKWFRRKLEDKNCLILIALLRNKAVGVFRMQAEEEKLMISYSLAGEERGRGLGALLVQEGMHYENKHRLLSSAICNPVFCAEVKKDNPASIHIMRQCGFWETEKKDYLIFEKALERK